MAKPLTKERTEEILGDKEIWCHRDYCVYNQDLLCTYNKEDICPFSDED